MQEFLKKYPWLKGYDPYPETENPVCAFEWLPKGWVIAFGEELCQELDVALRKTELYNEAYVVEAKEKLGQLRLYFHPSNEEIENIIRKYEVISEHICENCGAVDVPMLNLGGWFSPYCRECFDKFNDKGRYKSFEEVSGKISEIPNVVKWRRYTKDGWQDFEMDISEIVEKLRKKSNREFGQCQAE